MQVRFEQGTASLHAMLPVRPPYDWRAMIRFLESRAIAGVESVDAQSYARTIHIDGQTGSLMVAPSETGGGSLSVALHGIDEARIAPILARLRQLFDLDTDPEAVRAGLSRDPLVAQLFARNPGLRVPGAWDGFELGVRAILGQQVTVNAATCLAGRLVATFGRRLAPKGSQADLGLTHLFPSPECLAGADIAAALKMPRSRGNAIRSFAAAVAENPDLLAPGQGLAIAVARLTALPGIGEWTAQYIAMRALREPDAMPVGDIGLLRALDQGDGRPTARELLARSQSWRPWRAYAVMQLWAGDAEAARNRANSKATAGMPG